jgi:hypothetical protein
VNVESGSPYETAQQSEQKQNKENKEQEFRNACRRNGDPCKSENRGNYGYHEKCQCPTKHRRPPCAFAATARTPRITLPVYAIPH